jgi:hypothetical protein
MSRMPDDNAVGELLKQGLRRLPVPEPSAAFDAAVRARLHRPEPRWQWLWNIGTPVLVPAVCSLIVTLAVLKGIGAPQAGAPGTKIQAEGNIALERGVDRVRSVEQGLEHIDRDTPSLGGFGTLRRAERVEREPQLQPRSRRGTSERRIAGEAGERV